MITTNKLVTDLKQRIEHYLQQCLPTKTTTPERLHQAMHYAVFNGGKRIRPLLVYATGQLFSAELSQMDAPAAAIELIHCYSLVHDDLPAMDNDDYRRGQPSCHKAFDEATAILVGDALQSLAFELIADQPQMVKTLANAAGSQGMVGGQQLDLDIKQANAAELQQIQQLKTAALFQASIRLGAIAASSRNQQQLMLLDQLGQNLGLAFQIQDDVFDHDQQQMQQPQDLYKKALNLLDSIDGDTKTLRILCQLLQQRQS